MTASTSKKIQQLPQSVISYIAAGEVIERPASALKELIENAIDSNAKSIKVIVKKSGLSEITVIDDGNGIEKDQLALAVQTHTTSKLSSLNDLEKIQTYGFRGEALASIAALANLSIASRPSDQSDGAIISLSGAYNGEEAIPKVMAPGTKIVVAGLFQHAPVRMKFMKTENAELTHIYTIFKQQALTAPSIEMQIFNNEQLHKKYDAVKNLNQRVFDVLGNKFKQEATYINYETSNIKVSGYMNFEGTGSNINQFCYINNRFIKDKVIIQAIRRALAEEMRKANVPYVLYITMPHNYYDVNAHPSKLEVRFKESKAIYKIIYQAIISAIDTPIGKNPSIELTTKIQHNKLYKSDVQAEVFSNRLASSNISNAKTKNINKESQQINEDNINDFENYDDPQELQSLGKPIGLCHGIYLMAEHTEGVVIIDIHAAHERILYEELKENLKKKQAQAQKLLESIPLDLEPIELETIENNRQDLSNVGMVINNKDGIEHLVAIPSILANKDVDYLAMVNMCINELIDSGMILSVESKTNYILSSIACHSAVRGSNPFINEAGQKELLEKMKTTIRSGKCNHGRPCWKLISINELDKQFERGR